MTTFFALQYWNLHVLLMKIDTSVKGGGQILTKKLNDELGSKKGRILKFVTFWPS
jgi:hypothetical protein